MSSVNPNPPVIKFSEVSEVNHTHHIKFIPDKEQKHIPLEVALACIENLKKEVEASCIKSNETNTPLSGRVISSVIEQNCEALSNALAALENNKAKLEVCCNNFDQLIHSFRSDSITFSRNKEFNDNRDELRSVIEKLNDQICCIKKIINEILHS